MPDGVWEWPPPGDGRRVEGREALRAYFGSRPGGRLSRRVMSTLPVTVTSADTATATSYLTTCRVDGRTGAHGMVPTGPPVQAGDYTDVFRRTGGDEWLLVSRALRLPFGGPTPRAWPQGRAQPPGGRFRPGR